MIRSIMAIWDNPKDSVAFGDPVVKTKKRTGKLKDSYDMYLTVPIFNVCKANGRVYKKFYGTAELYNLKTKTLQSGFWHILKFLTILWGVFLIQGCASKDVYNIVDDTTPMEIVNNNGEICKDTQMIIDPKRITYFYPMCNIRVYVYPKERLLPQIQDTPAEKTKQSNKKKY